jgi:hypothetical protein
MLRWLHIIMAQSDFFINAVELIDLEGATNIPSVLRYERGTREPLIGSAARSKARQREELNEDFKVDLGNCRPGTTGANSSIVRMVRKGQLPN